MKHDELLAKIDHNLSAEVWLFHMGEALRAVVELHQPYGDVQCSICENGQWPCSTIKTISEALS